MQEAGAGLAVCAQPGLQGQLQCWGWHTGFPPGISPEPSVLPAPVTSAPPDASPACECLQVCWEHTQTEAGTGTGLRTAFVPLLINFSHLLQHSLSVLNTGRSVLTYFGKLFFCGSFVFLNLVENGDF